MSAHCGARRFIATQQEGLALLREPQNLGPRRGAPRLPLVCIEMDGDQSRFLVAKAQVLQQLSDGEDVVEDAETVVNQLLDHGRAPAVTAQPGLTGPSSMRVARGAFWAGVSLGGRPGGFLRGAPWLP